jgi:hypothetical protein
MKPGLVIALACGLTVPAAAGEITSAYTSFELGKCRQVEPPDQYVFEGRWVCKGYGGIDIVYSGEDSRSYVAFGRGGEKHCAALKTFDAFNTALSPVEWRLDNGKPFAAIERWSVTNGEGAQSTWLVVTALRDRDSCHAAYVSGAYAEANAQARKAADETAPGFDCARDKPKLVSVKADAPNNLEPCREIEGWRAH